MEGWGGMDGWMFGLTGWTDGEDAWMDGLMDGWLIGGLVGWSCACGPRVAQVREGGVRAQARLPYLRATQGTKAIRETQGLPRDAGHAAGLLQCFEPSPNSPKALGRRCEGLAAATVSRKAKPWPTWRGEAGLTR